MPLLGAHMSIAGGIHLAFDRLDKIRGDALQIFTASHRQWRLSKKIGAREIELFRSRWRQSGRPPVAAHDIYLINLAAKDEVILSMSIAAFAEELKRCADLAIPYLVMHPGAHLGEGTQEGLLRFVENLDRAIETSKVQSVSVLIENTAGQGSSLGASFEEIGFILQNSQFGAAMGVCYDTSHGFAAGYDMRNKEAYDRTFSNFDKVIGIDRLKFFHLNDSKRELGARVDRHEHIGKGKIGLKGFSLLLNDPRFRDHPMVLETPKGKDLKEDKINMHILRSLLERN
ncbi:MAG TPA: deoxyribonuclease IV [Syntrophobacteraceae bacterium]|nr:deoxyribonuclease IV [Syntrophobacteraceae bacterium]